MTKPESKIDSEMRIVSEERIRVRYGETDQMGHAYYANYFFWFEQARGRWCRDRGFSYKQMEAMGYKLPVVEAHINYVGEVLYDDWIVVRVWLSEMKRASMRFDYEVVNEASGNVTTRGYSWHVLIGSERRAITMPEAIKELLKRNPANFQPLA